MSDYTDIERTFVQSFIARKCFTSQEAIECLANIRRVGGLQDEVGENDLQVTINKINKQLDPLGLSIVKTRDEEDPNLFYYTLVNKLPNKTAQLATTLTANEMDFFRVLLDQIFVGDQHTPEQDQFWIPVSKLSTCHKIQSANILSDEQRNNAAEEQNGADDATRITTISRKPLTEAEYKSLFDTLCEELWLTVTVSNGTRKISPSPRLLAELKSYLVERYGPATETSDELNIDRHNQLRFCLGCKNIFTKGKQCSGTNCPSRLHLSCEDAFYRHNANSALCPTCHTDLKDSSVSVGP